MACTKQYATELPGALRHHSLPLVLCQLQLWRARQQAAPIKNCVIPVIPCVFSEGNSTSIPAKAGPFCGIYLYNPSHCLEHREDGFSVRLSSPQDTSKTIQDNPKQSKTIQNNPNQSETIENNPKQCKTMQNNPKQPKTIQNNPKQSRITETSHQKHPKSAEHHTK